MSKIKSIICFYGESSLDKRSFYDCDCLNCTGCWVSVAATEASADGYVQNPNFFECPYCGSENCHSEYRSVDIINKL